MTSALILMRILVCHTDQPTRKITTFVKSQIYLGLKREQGILISITIAKRIITTPNMWCNLNNTNLLAANYKFLKIVTSMVPIF